MNTGKTTDITCYCIFNMYKGTTVPDFQPFELRFDTNTNGLRLYKLANKSEVAHVYKNRQCTRY